MRSFPLRHNEFSFLITDNPRPGPSQKRTNNEVQEDDSSTGEKTATPRKRNPRNKALWEYFMKEDPEKAEDPQYPGAHCKLCGQLVKRKQGSPTRSQLAMS